MTQTRKLHFTYDPLSLVRLALDRYAEELEGKDTKAIQFARYDYLHTMTTEELEEYLQCYIEDENLDAITLEDWRKDSEFIFRYIYQSERYKSLEFHYKKKGHGITGMGVVDTSDNTFYDCGFTQHWQKVMQIIKEKYPQYHEALEEMNVDERLNEYNGIKRQELDQFIMERFELVGNNKPLDDYLN